MSQKYEYFGKYILLEKLATGGMAEVWLARAPGAGGIGKFVAIKKILPQYSDNPEFMQMFKDEAAIAMNLSHSNIVSIYEFGQEKHQLFLVMDYVEGRNLRQILNKLKQSNVKFSFDQIIYAIKEVAGGLDHAHRTLNSATGKPLNITHRDMSPQNIMITFEGEVKIVDFGIAKAESQLENTRTGTLKGKFGYMSPEQAEGQVTDLRTDIFSLGIVLWELLANDRLFIANNEINTLNKIRECNVPALSKINPNIPPELERIAMKALTRDRNLRYQTAAAMHRDLSRFLNRQYPDFSSHDFSVFIKTLFTDDILEIRKRLIEYAKVQPQTISSSKLDEGDKTLVTPMPDKTEPSYAPTQTFQSGISIHNSGEGSELGDEDETPRPTSSTGEINLSGEGTNKTKSLSGYAIENLGSNQNKPTVLDAKSLENTINKNLAARYPVGKQKANDGTIDLATNPGMKSSGARRRQGQNSQQNQSPGPSSLNLMIFVAFTIMTYVVGTTYFPDHTQRLEKAIVNLLSQGFPRHTKSANGKSSNAVDKTAGAQAQQNPAAIDSTTTPLPPSGQAPVAMEFVNLTGLVVNSNPSGAEIYLNGLNTGKTTPARIEVPAEAAFSLTLKIPRFIDYTKSNLTVETIGRSFTATMQKAMVSYVDIDVKPPRNVRVFVNGTLLKDELLPINKYAVPAGTPVLIRAENSLTGIAAEEIVTLKEDQRYKVVLRLDKSTRKPSSR